MIVLDASVLIAHLDERDVHHERASRLIAETGTEPLGASTISLAETLVAPARAGRLDEATTALTRLGIEELTMGEDAPSRLVRLRANTQRKLPDCCVLLGAQHRNGAVASFDAALIRAADDLGLATLS
ncbi:MAG: type II toxin-antitoxin system VapC family toxin [Solirubrobacterales bacterium]